MYCVPGVNRGGVLGNAGIVSSGLDRNCQTIQYSSGVTPCTSCTRLATSLYACFGFLAFAFGTDGLDGEVGLYVYVV